MSYFAFNKIKDHSFFLKTYYSFFTFILIEILEAGAEYHGDSKIFVFVF